MQKLCGGYAVLQTKAINEANLYVECIYVEVMRGLCAGYAEVAVLQWRYTKNSMHSLCGGPAEVIFGSDPPFCIKTFDVEVTHKVVVQQPRPLGIAGDPCDAKAIRKLVVVQLKPPDTADLSFCKGRLEPLNAPFKQSFRMLTYA